MRQSHTAVIERNVTWADRFETEPYEVGWASEALYFVRALSVSDVPASITARVQISPDGIHWCDAGAELALPTEDEDVAFCRVTHFGGWLRMVGELPTGAELTVIAYLVLKE